MLLNNPPLEIITGHSDKMPELVREVLDRHDIEWERWGFAVWKIL